MRASRQERQHASHLRRLLAENNINYDKLKQAYETGAKEGLESVIKNEVSMVLLILVKLVIFKKLLGILLYHFKSVNYD